MKEKSENFFMKEKAWVFLFAIAFLAAGYTTVVAVIQLNTFLRLDKNIISSIDNFEIIPNGNKFSLLAKYSYNVKNKNWGGKYIFKSKLFLNDLAAKRELTVMKNKKDMQLWYASKDPSLSSLEKDFPIKNFLYAIISWIVILYFFWLRNRIKNFL